MLCLLNKFPWHIFVLGRQTQKLWRPALTDSEYPAFPHCGAPFLPTYINEAYPVPEEQNESEVHYLLLLLLQRL